MYVTRCIVIGLVCLTGSRGVTADEDADRRSLPLEHLDRRIVAEPEYESTPRYVLLAFGADASSLMWLVEDGRRLYVDRNGNGDLTDDGPPIEPSDERELAAPQWSFAYAVGDMEFPGGQRHEGFRMRRWNYDHSQDGSSLSVTVNGITPMYAGWSPLWSGSPEQARIIHFGGPLEPRKLRGEAITLRPGVQGFSIAFINQGLGERAHSRLSIKAVPKSVVPVVEITWPTALDEPLKTTHRLTERCCYWEFYTESLEVPDGAVEGTATARVWLPGYVNPFGYRTTELSIPVQASPAE